MQADLTFELDSESEVPEFVQRQMHRHCVAARECYRLRDEANALGDPSLADFYLDAGDRFLVRANALGDEWAEYTSDMPSDEWDRIWRWNS